MTAFTSWEELYVLIRQWLAAGQGEWKVAERLVAEYGLCDIEGAFWVIDEALGWEPGDVVRRSTSTENSM